MSAAEAHHEWQLAAPAYGGTAAVPGSAPVLQKYDSSDLVNAFMKDPTASLPFGDVDLVYEPAGRSLLLKTDVRKLYLDTHKRFYLVVCELHCRAPGFPNASREDVCEAGFVIRRRVPPPDLGDALAGELGQFVERVRSARAGVDAARLASEANVRVAVVSDPPANGSQEVAPLFVQLAEPAAAGIPLPPMEDVVLPAFVRQHVDPHPIPIYPSADDVASQMEQELDDWRAQLAEYVDEHDLRLLPQSWVADPRAPGLGGWTSVDETPQQLDEVVVPLYPLVPDPAAADHPARGRTIYFGLVPTASGDVDTTGAPRFDEHALYEIRCFVRRHNPGCPRTAHGRDCHGPLFWSRPTAPYRVAGHFDLHGTSQRPVAVRMPSFAALKAQADALPGGAKLAKRGPDGKPVLVNGRPVADPTEVAPAPCGRGAPFRISLPKASLPRMVEPPPSLLPPSLLPPVPFGVGSGSFGLSIPLVTIVALFVLRIFMALLSLIFPPLNFLKALAFAAGNPVEDPFLVTEQMSMAVLYEVSAPEASVTSCLPPLPGVSA